ncbi:hypothetical protein [Kamptonema formosum]|uniref:hypothetical protein n=1 Tax=Kamptonema formosum TaxID=331992 RepID=UPI0012DE2C77|nr:hypothetical protein [Oscillatoria sp. PCC 10802]
MPIAIETRFPDIKFGRYRRERQAQQYFRVIFECLPVPVGHSSRPYMRTPIPLFLI